MTSPRNFQVDLRGIINLLSDHLYSGPQVYVRELLPNARCRSALFPVLPAD